MKTTNKKMYGDIMVSKLQFLWNNYTNIFKSLRDGFASFKLIKILNNEKFFLKPFQDFML